MTVPEQVEVIKGLAETAAIVVGGLWAAWTFHKLQRARASEAEVNRALAETRESERRLLAQEPNLEIDITDVAEYHVPGLEQGCLGIGVQFANTGLRNLEVILDGSALSVGRLVLGDRRRLRLTDIHRSAAHYLPETGPALQQMTSRVFRVGQRRRVLLIGRIAGPGLYLVQVQVLYRGIEFEVETPAEDFGVVVRAVEQRLVRVVGEDAGPAVAEPPSPPSAR